MNARSVIASQGSGVRRARWAASMRSFLLTPDTSRLTPDGRKIGRQRVRFCQPADSRPGHVTGASSALPSSVVYACKAHASTAEQRSGDGRRATGNRSGSRLPLPASPALPDRLSFPIVALYSRYPHSLLVGGDTFDPTFLASRLPPHAPSLLLPIEGSGGSWGAGMLSVGPTVSCELAPSGQDTSIQGRAGGYTSPLALPLRPGPRSRQARALAIVPGTPGGFDQVSGVRDRQRRTPLDPRGVCLLAPGRFQLLESLRWMAGAKRAPRCTVPKPDWSSGSPAIHRGDFSFPFIPSIST